MESQSEQFEREAEETRRQLAGTLDELRDRITPGRVADQLIDYTREGSAAEFLRNIGREVRENPMPLVLIGIGIAWLMVASNRTSRVAIASAADSVARTAADVGTATSAVVTRTTEWGQQRATRLSERASDAASTVSDKVAELAGRAREATEGLAERARAGSAVAGAPFDKAKPPFSGAAERDGRAVESAVESVHREREDARAVEMAAHEHR
jgi:gas vesicle protein